MMRFAAPVAAALLLAACDGGQEAPAEAPSVAGNGTSAAAAPPGAAPDAPAVPAPGGGTKAKGEAASASAAPAEPPASADPCLMQGGERLEVAPLRAIGTEPFWAARILGRCVTYSHPEDQKGIRVWTRFTPAPGGGTWSGALGGRRFELRTRAQPGCSDGMSDERYPIAVDLQVGGERRSGCAEPI